MALTTKEGQGLAKGYKKKALSQTEINIRRKCGFVGNDFSKIERTPIKTLSPALRQVSQSNHQ